jgi:hypothetical protein
MNTKEVKRREEEFYRWLQNKKGFTFIELEVVRTFVRMKQDLAIDKREKYEHL